MKWATRDFVHIDRVAAPWLIRRFIDKEAVFILLPSAEPGPPPEDAIPFGLPGVELAAHDADGSTFRKIMRKYELSMPALEMLASIVEDAIRYYLDEKLGDGGRVDVLKFPEAVGLVALSEGMMYAKPDDQSNLLGSLAIYDALYAYCQTQILAKEKPGLLDGPPFRIVPQVKPSLVPPPFYEG